MWFLKRSDFIYLIEYYRLESINRIGILLFNSYQQEKAKQFLSKYLSFIKLLSWRSEQNLHPSLLVNFIYQNIAINIFAFMLPCRNQILLCATWLQDQAYIPKKHMGINYWYETSYHIYVVIREMWLSDIYHVYQKDLIAHHGYRWVPLNHVLKITKESITCKESIIIFARSKVIYFSKPTSISNIFPK